MSGQGDFPFRSSWFLNRQSGLNQQEAWRQIPVLWTPVLTVRNTEDSGLVWTDWFFEGVTTTPLSLAATEAPDVAAFEVSVTARLAATEAPDVAVFEISVTARLAATEAQDIAAFAMEASAAATPLALAATEAPDVAAFLLTPSAVPAPSGGNYGAGGGQGGISFKKLVDEIFEEEFSPKPVAVTVGPRVFTEPDIATLLPVPKLQPRDNSDEDLVLLLFLD